MEKLYLILENGIVFEGKQFGAEISEETVSGELVFNTGMAGYLETISDPTNYGQIVIQTFPLIGNYGVIPSDCESTPKLKAYIVRQWCKEPSNFRSEGDLFTFLLDNNIVGLYGIDTRALTRIIRENGAMNAVISKTPDVDIEKLKSNKIKDAVKETSRKEKETFTSEKQLFKVAVYDFGVTKNLISELTSRGCDVTVFPYNTKASEILEFKPDGVVLSDGPGNPAENVEVIAEVKKLLESNLPIFGISLGHQILASAGGAKTIKLKHGHRGGNYPVSDIKTGKTYITTQNHGYAVENSSLPSNITATFINVNDKTCEGIEFTDKPAFSVQFRFDTSDNPNNTSFLFDKFEENIKKVRNN